MKEAIQRLVQGKDLTGEQVEGVMRTIMEGGATPSQIASYLTALRCKGETVEEMVASAQVMRGYAEPINPRSRPLIDTCGTGGDGQGTFNISTTAAFVVSGGGLRVAKHGNRSVSSRSGSADVLEALGVDLHLSPREVEEAIDTVGMGFLFAPQLHPAMAQAATPRREMGIATIFNLLGPLTSPARAEYQILGVYEREQVMPMAQALGELGVQGALVFHGAHGLDELSTTGENQVAQLRDGKVRASVLSPEDAGLPRASLDQLKGGTPEENACICREVLSNQEGPPSHIVLLNAAAAFLAAGRVETIAEGVEWSREVVASGRALEKLELLVSFSQRQMS